MRITHTRNLFNSFYNHINNLAISGSLTTGDGGVNFKDAYPLPEQLKKMVPLKDYDSSDSSLICLPIISVETINSRENSYQLGSTTKERETQVAVTIFAENEIQAEYLADFVVSGTTQHNLRLYDYNDNYTSPPDEGKIFVNDDYLMAMHYSQGTNNILVNNIDILFTLVTINKH